MEKTVTVGRRKAAVARVFLSPSGGGTFIVNNRDLEVYFPLDLLRMKIAEPFVALNLNQSDFDIKVNVNGGGISGQAESVRLGIARALIEIDLENRPALKRQGLLTRDARIVERKKYGKKKARKSTQFSKR
jgi:small subunit ribosomal protein S9